MALSTLSSVKAGIEAMRIQRCAASQMAKKGMSTHLLVEMWRSPFSILADAQTIKKALARTNGNGTTNKDCSIRVHQFNPYGVSGTYNGPEAHILIHTWPENGYAAIDIFSRGKESAYKVLEKMKEELQPEYLHVLEVQRGQLINMEDT